MGYLYVMESKSPDGKSFSKIGISEHDPEIRKKGIQTGCPFKIINIWVSRNIPDFRDCEKYMHRELAAYNTHGEWFDVPFVKIVALADKITTDGYMHALIERLSKIERQVRIAEKQISDINAEIDFIKYDYMGAVV